MKSLAVLLLAAVLQAISGEEVLPGPCREWSQGERWLCTSEETYQRCNEFPWPDCPQADNSAPTQPSGYCRLVHGVCEYTESSPKCYSGYTNCFQPYCATKNETSSYSCPRTPTLDIMCLPVDDSCQWFNPCRAWKGHCQSPYCCGTLSEYYRFIFGPTPMCMMPEEETVEPVPPGECVITNGECRWSNCTAYLDWCQSFWTCGTQYDHALYMASPPPPCPAPPPGHKPPPVPGDCRFSLEKQSCQFFPAREEGSVQHVDSDIKNENLSLE